MAKRTRKCLGVPHIVVTVCLNSKKETQRILIVRSAKSITVWIAELAITMVRIAMSIRK